MRFQIGGNLHPEHEVNVTKMEIQPVFSPRNDRVFSLKKIHIVGEIQLTPAENAAARDANPLIETANRQALFNTKIGTLIDWYADNYQSAGLLHDDGSRTRHFLDNAAANNISGVRVLYRSWPRGEGDEYATVRTFYIILGALFDEADSQIYAYREEIDIIGTAATHWQWVENQTGAPEYQRIFNLTRQKIIQYGSIVGVSTWILGNVPPPLFPNWEHGDQRVQKYEYPKWHGNAYRLYGYRWTYHMEAPTGQVAIPNLY